MAKKSGAEDCDESPAPFIWNNPMKNIRQKSYTGCYDSITPSALRALADLLECEELPADPITILSLETLGYSVDLESGEIVDGEQKRVGSVADLTPLNGPPDMPPILTLIDVLKHPRTTLVVDGMTMWWDEVLLRYKTSAVDSIEPTLHTTCVGALNTIFAQEVAGES